MATAKEDYEPGWWGSFRSVTDEYRKLRNLGWRATDAIETARVRERFYALECAGKVRLDCVVDELPYEHGDCGDEDATNRRIDSEGLWGLVGYATGPEGREEVTESCFGFIGYDWQNSLHDTDIMRACLAIAELRACECPKVSTCNGRAA